MPLSYVQMLQLSTRIRNGATLTAKQSAQLTARGIIPSTISCGAGGVFAGSGRNRRTIFSSDSNELKLFGNNIRKLRDGESIFLDSKSVTSIMYKILSEAKENTPVDKRYIGFRANTTKKQETLKNIPVILNAETRKDYGVDLSTGEYYIGKRERSAKAGRALKSDKYTEKIDIDLSGFIIDGENYNFSEETKKKIKNKFSGDNREQRRNLWYNLDKNSLEYYKIRKSHNALNSETRNTTIGYAFSDGQEHGGEEELKRSGMYDKKTHTISFDPTRFGTKYNYASIQHNRLDFNHLVGGPLFLYNAYMKYRNELSNAIMSSIKDFRNEQTRISEQNAKQKAIEKRAKRNAYMRGWRNKNKNKVTSTIKERTNDEIRAVQDQARKFGKAIKVTSKEPWKYKGITRSGKNITDILGW